MPGMVILVLLRINSVVLVMCQAVPALLALVIVHLLSVMEQMMQVTVVIQAQLVQKQVIVHPLFQITTHIMSLLLPAEKMLTLITTAHFADMTLPVTLQTAAVFVTTMALAATSPAS